MGATVEIAILGTEEFRDFVNLFTKEARRKVNIAIVQGAHMIEASAKKYVPVDTGNLKSKITVIKRDEAGRFVVCADGHSWTFLRCSRLCGRMALQLPHHSCCS